VSALRRLETDLLDHLAREETLLLVNRQAGEQELPDAPRH